MPARMLAAAASWDETTTRSLDRFRDEFPLPQLARIVKGDSSSCVLLVPSNGTVKIAAECVKFKDGKAKPFGVGLSIPGDYDGLFEILSEDGRAAKPMESVVQLVRAAPDSCVAREGVRAWAGRGDGTEPVTARWRVVSRGSRLVLVGQVSANGAHLATKSDTASDKNRFLRCFDENGDSVYFRLDQKAKFSACARDDGLAGLHNVGQLMKKRFPITVRLIVGRKPVSCKNFVPEMRLHSTHDDGNCVYALPLDTNDPKCLISVSGTSELRATTNSEHLSRMPEFDRMLNESRKLMANIRTTDPRRNIVRKWSWTKRLTLRRTTSDPSSHDGAEGYDKSYDEIDQLYDYVRGFVPMPPIPPPIESIPTRRHSVPVCPTRRYAPSPARRRQRLIRVKKSPSSPVFRTRYKSLTDLTADADSSNSANSTKNETNVSKGLLFRPRSLTNLLFGAKSEEKSKCLGTLYL